MSDITIIGGGAAARASGDLLFAAGFQLRRTIDLEEDGRGPVILGETAAAHTIARQAIAAGRHLLLANPSQFTPDRLGLLFEGRRKAQALFLWSGRRHLPGFRFLRSLVESDTAWRPHYLRHEVLMMEAPSAGPANWALIESAALMTALVGAEPEACTAAGADNPLRNSAELTMLALDFPTLTAFLQLGLGEPVARRETLLAAEGRKAYFDEINQSTPVRMIFDDPGMEKAAPTRWLSAAAPSAEEIARQQCLAFLDATLHAEEAQQEAQLWTTALAISEAARRSAASENARTAVQPVFAAEAPPFRLLSIG